MRRALRSPIARYVCNHHVYCDYYALPHHGRAEQRGAAGGGWRAAESVH